jgi:hypothetical protein
MTNIITINSLSRINIGKCESNDNTYYLNSRIQLSKKFMSIPFGTTRVRFQEIEMFNYSLEELDKKEKDKYYYKLIIIRKINLCNSSIISLFPKNGWTNLIISNIKKENNFNYEYVNNNIPENYCDFEINFAEIYKKIGIVIPFFGRYEYTKIFLESLKKSDLQDVILILVDESLTKDLNQDKIIANKLIKDFAIDNVPIIKIFKKNHGNMNDSILLGLDVLGNICDILMTIDSDTQQKYNFVEKSIQILHEVDEMFNNKNIVVSGFNANSHKIEKEFDNFYTKKTVGGCHLCFKKELYYDKLRFCLSSHKWDTNIYNIINKNNGIIAISKPSLVEHIGEISSVRNEINMVKSIDF